jgi:hypothetical protein
MDMMSVSLVWWFARHVDELGGPYEARLPYSCSRRRRAGKVRGRASGEHPRDDRVGQIRMIPAVRVEISLLGRFFVGG